MAEGKPSARDSGNRKAPKASTRVPNATGAVVPKSTQIPKNTQGVPKNTQGVPKNTQGVPKSTQIPDPRDPRKSAKKPVDEMEGLFVDPEPQSSKKSKAARASDRRRERGQAPQPAGVPDTRTSMPNRDPPSPSVKSQMSDMKGFARATLTCTRGPEEGLSLNLIEGSYSVGRARENSFVLKDIAASRRHLRIDVDGRGARVIDLGSGNGSRVNGRRISEHELKHGDRIEIGGSVLLYQERGKGPVEQAPAAPVDDAQERVIRAAEKLAAELSERMRFGDEPPSQSAFEDGHVAKTRAIPQAQKKEIEAELARVKAAQQGQRQAPEKLWKETFTNLPLDRIVPAEEPLRGGSRAVADQVPPSQPLMVPVAVRAPLPRPQPLPMPPPPEEEYDVSSSQSRGGSSSFMVSLLVTALVVLLGGGGVLIAFMVTHHKSASASESSDDDMQRTFDEAMANYDKSADAGDWVSAIESATIASRMRPNDKAAQRALKDARKHLDDQKKPSLAPATPPPATPPPVETQAPPPPPPPTPAPVASAPPPPAPAPPTPAPPAPKPKVRSSSSSASSSSSSASSSAAKETKESSAPPPPKPKKSGGRTMSDEQAQAKFQEAVDALRQKDNKTGCKTLEEIADRAPAESRWQEKALNLYNRRCGD